MLSHNNLSSSIVINNDNNVYLYLNQSMQSPQLKGSNIFLFMYDLTERNVKKKWKEKENHKTYNQFRMIDNINMIQPDVFNLNILNFTWQHF